MSCVTKAMPIHFINVRCHIKQPKSKKSHKTCLTNHTLSISHHIMPLVINSLGANTHTYQCVSQSNFKKTGAVPGLENLYYMLKNSLTMKC